MVAPHFGGPVASLVFSNALFGLLSSIYSDYAGVADLDQDCIKVQVITELGYMGFVIRVCGIISTTTLRVRR